MRGMDYFIKRTIFALITVFVAISLNFVLFRAIPGNAVSGLKCLHCTKQFKEAITKQYGLDKTKWQQYVVYLDRLAHGDLGTSVSDNRPVWDDIKQPLLNTLPMLVVGTAPSFSSSDLRSWARPTVLPSGVRNTKSPKPKYSVMKPRRSDSSVCEPLSKKLAPTDAAPTA